MILSLMRTLLPMFIEFLFLWKLMDTDVSNFLRQPTRKNAIMQEMLEEPLDLSMIPPSQVDHNWHPKALFPVRDEVEDDRALPVVQRLPTGKRRRLNVQSAGISFNREAEDDRVFPVVQSLSNGKRRRLNEEPVRGLPVVEEEFEAVLVEYEETFDSEDPIQEVDEDILQNVVDGGGGSVESSSADTSSASVEETADQEIPAQSYGSGFWIDDQGRPRRFSCRLLGEQ
jgi:hypothetical protein